MTTTTDTLLDLTLAAARRDEQMATPDGRFVRRLTHGVHIRPLPTLADHRGPCVSCSIHAGHIILIHWCLRTCSRSLAWSKAGIFIASTKIGTP
jgi:hypothetical protein